MTDAPETREAKALRQALDIDQLLRELAITQDEVDLLNALAAGVPVQNGRLALQALKVKLEYSTPRPAQRIGIQLLPPVTISNPFFLPGNGEPEVVTMHALPEGKK